MHRYFVLLMLSAMLIGLTPINARSDVNVGISADRDGIKEFYLSIGTHYGAKEPEVEKVRARSLPADEMAVVFFISSHSGISPLIIADLRLGGLSWMDISLRYGLNASVYYVKFAADPGPPYGHAWGYYHKTPKKKWNKIKLGDADIINLVNLKFLSEEYQCSPEKIVHMKKKGKSFAGMNSQFKKDRAEKKNKEAKAQKAAQHKGKKGKGKK